MIRQSLIFLAFLLTLSLSIETSTESDKAAQELLEKPQLETNAIIDGNNATESSILQRSFINGVASSFSMIFTSEILDKTFFIAVVMAMRHSRITVYCGAIAALGLMTVLSATVGVLTTFVPRWITYYASAALMFGFAIKMFYDAYKMNAQKGQEEFEEVEREVEKREKDESDRLLESGSDASIPPPKEPTACRTFAKIFVETFVLTFLAEWGDRSQVATVLLAATDNVFGVLVGGVLGHALCTGIAVVGGRAVAECITVRTVTIIGGIVFLLFAVLALVFNDINPVTSA
ncbi:hypothetical protein PENTCL1PPCAC_16607 [Pristionchus entomophagus]|uniref:GDT1 family protein n=1 Tax=Pristionchus entomophagus TaxID=358040 RepID=A0AAV5TJR9_9BILA|nr:hypothetical protein PENTCL1PPCAC_16607 [Pristionchus entomophagus]